MRELAKDYQELLELFTSHGVDFMVCGSYALAVHAKPRYTEDLDLWVAKTRENAERLCAAVNEFGIGVSLENCMEILEERKMIVFGIPPLRVEILNFQDGCDYVVAKSRVVLGNFSGLEVPVISLADFVATKREVDRVKDRLDLELLREQIGELPEKGS